MAVTRYSYDASKALGGVLSVALNKLSEGRAGLLRWTAAADAATDAGTNKMALIGGDFGATTSADATLMWDQNLTIKTLLNTADVGGYGAAVASGDKGTPG